MIEVTTQEMKVACIVCCPMCDEDKCVGRFNCDEIKRYIRRIAKEGGVNDN
jgi:hypothetical protein